MSKLYAILGEVYDRGFRDGDPMLPEQNPILSGFIYKKRQEIENTLCEFVGASDIPDWDNEYGMCNTCDFQPSDGSMDCLCVYRNKLRDEIKKRISEL